MLWTGSAVLAGLGGQLAGGIGGKYYGGVVIGGLMTAVSPLFTYFLLTRVWCVFRGGWVGDSANVFRFRGCRYRRRSTIKSMGGGRTMSYGRRARQSSGRSCFRWECRNYTVVVRRYPEAQQDRRGETSSGGNERACT